jgi:hypothetical protein
MRDQFLRMKESHRLATSNRTAELCVDDICVTRDEILGMKESQAASAGASRLRDTVEAPTGQPSSSEDDSGDSVEPTSANVQSATNTLPDAGESVDNSDRALEIPPNQRADDSSEAPSLEDANDNSPADPLPSTGTDD